MNTKDRVPLYVNACAEMGIEVEPPDVNVSQTDFAVVEGKIRFGLNAVKNVGEGAAAAIVAARGSGGAYKSLWELTERVPTTVANKRALESLIMCGALDLDRRVAERHARRARRGARVRREAAGGHLLRPESMFEVEHRRSPPTSTRRTTSCGWRRSRSASTSPSIR